MAALMSVRKAWLTGSSWGEGTVTQLSVSIRIRLTDKTVSNKRRRMLQEILTTHTYLLFLLG